VITEGLPGGFNYTITENFEDRLVLHGFGDVLRINNKVGYGIHVIMRHAGPGDMPSGFF